VKVVLAESSIAVERRRVANAEGGTVGTTTTVTRSHDLNVAGLC